MESLHCVVGKGCLLWPVRSLGKTLLDCVLLHFVHHSQTSPEFQVSLDFLICIPVPYDEKNIFFLVLVLENLIGLLRTVQLQLFLAKIWISVILNGLPWKRTEIILSSLKWKWKWSHSVVSNSLSPHGLKPTMLLYPWDFPGKSTGVGCHFLLQSIFPTQGSNLGLPDCR